VKKPGVIPAFFVSAVVIQSLEHAESSIRANFFKKLWKTFVSAGQQGLFG
jgi:hypothetical protein